MKLRTPIISSASADASAEARVAAYDGLRDWSEHANELVLECRSAARWRSTTITVRI